MSWLFTRLVVVTCIVGLSNKPYIPVSVSQTPDMAYAHTNVESNLNNSNSSQTNGKYNSNGGDGLRINYSTDNNINNYSNVNRFTYNNQNSIRYDCDDYYRFCNNVKKTFKRVRYIDSISGINYKEYGNNNGEVKLYRLEIVIDQAQETNSMLSLATFIEPSCSHNESCGFLKYAATNAISIGLVGNIRRTYPNNILVGVEETNYQLNQFTQFLSVCKLQSMFMHMDIYETDINSYLYIGFRIKTSFLFPTQESPTADIRDDFTDNQFETSHNNNDGGIPRTNSDERSSGSPHIDNTNDDGR